MEYLALFISENASFFESYGNWVLIPLFFIVLGVDHLVSKRFSLPKPAKWAISIFSIAITFVLGSLIFMTNFPLKPMVNSISKVQDNIGKQVYDFDFIDVRTDSLHNISDFEGKVILLNFWGTYCAPCIEEFPDLKQIESDYSDDALVIALSDESKDRILRFVSKIESPSIIGSFSSELWIELETFRPLTVIIDKNGIVKDYAFGKKDYNYFKLAIEDNL